MLKKAVIDEQEKTKLLQVWKLTDLELSNFTGLFPADNWLEFFFFLLPFYYVLKETVRQKDQSIRKYEQEIDSLQFRNDQVTQFDHFLFDY